MKQIKLSIIVRDKKKVEYPLFLGDRGVAGSCMN